MGLDEDVRNSLASQTQEKIQDTGVSLVMAVVESLAQSILYAALFLVSFVGLTILLKLLIRLWTWCCSCRGCTWLTPWAAP